MSVALFFLIRYFKNLIPSSNMKKMFYIVRCTGPMLDLIRDEEEEETV